MPIAELLHWWRMFADRRKAEHEAQKAANEGREPESEPQTLAKFKFRPPPK
jgi:hypothetical protein